MLRPGPNWYARSADEAEYPELWQGLVGAWSPCLSPPGGTVLRDLSGRQNHGTLTNMDAATDWVTSGGRRALDFDGSNDYVEASNSESLKITGELSLFAWVLTTATGPIENEGIAGKYLGAFNRRSYVIFCSTGGSSLGGVISSDGSATSVITSTSAINTGSWLYVGMSYKPSTYLRLWVNGKQVSEVTTSIPAAIASTVAPFWIATQFDPTNSGSAFYGQVSEVTVSRRAVTHDIAMAYYRLGPGGWATPRRRRWNYATAQTAIPYWIFARQNARLIGGGVS